MSLTPAERETVITMDDGSDLVHVYTAQRSVILRLGRDERWTQVSSGTYEGSPVAEYTIPASQWNPLTGTKRRGRRLSEEHLAKLMKGRESKSKLAEGVSEAPEEEFASETHTEGDAA